jgi:hypothetical protein
MKSFLIAALFLFAFGASIIRAQSTSNDSTIIVDVSNISLNQDNPSVTINRKNKDLILIGTASDFDDMDANGMLAYTSTDRGLSWSSSRLPLPINPDFYVYGEPSTAADDAGNFYYAYMANDGVNSAGNISIATSADGKTWKNATPINNNVINPGFPDGVYIAVDNSPSSSHYKRVYAVWDQFYSDDLLFTQEGVYISWSDNQCKTWSTPKFLGAGDDYQMCKTGKNGEIYVTSSYSEGIIGQGLFVSIDGGTTFNDAALPVGLGFFSNYPMITFGPDSGAAGLKGDLGFPAYPYIALDVDLTTGRIHAVTGDYEAGVADENYTYSDDNGTTWSVSQIIGITQQDSSDRFDPWVSVDQKTGEVSLLYYSSESDPKNILVAPYRLLLKDPITDPPQMLSAAFDPLIVETTDSTAPYIGDHTMSDAFDSVYIGTWTENRAGFTDADIFAYVTYPKSTKSSVEMPIVIHSSKLWLSAPYPNPSYANNITLSYYVPHATHLVLDLFDETGKAVKHLADKFISEESTFTEEYSLANLPSGSYIIRMMTDDGQASRKLVIIGE